MTSTPIPQRHVLFGQLVYGGHGVLNGFTGDDGKTTKTATIRIPKGELPPAVYAFKQDIGRKAVGMFGDGAFVKTPSGIKPTFKLVCWKDGDEQTEPLMHGHWIIKANSIFPFKIIGPDNRELNDAEKEEYVYGGQLVALRVEVDAYDGKESKGVTAYLQGMKIYGGGPRIQTSGDEAAVAELAAAGADALPAYMATLKLAAPAEAAEPVPVAQPAAGSAATPETAAAVPVQHIPGPGPQGKADAEEEIPW